MSNDFDPESIGDMQDLENILKSKSKIQPKPQNRSGVKAATLAKEICLEKEYEIRRKQNGKLLTKQTVNFLWMKKTLEGLYDNVQFEKETNTFYVWDCHR
jgi:hypothetical protein